uniref:Uncharacterized protein n=1 Tax=Physcomitrium patens TaxID=3218 RepID=A0A2K1ISR9_PHYPA|nr:hypothetical protein PHYPA_026449 [Physcomitrium patens]
MQYLEVGTWQRDVVSKNSHVSRPRPLCLLCIVVLTHYICVAGPAEFASAPEIGDSGDLFLVWVGWVQKTWTKFIAPLGERRPRG